MALLFPNVRVTLRILSDEEDPGVFVQSRTGQPNRLASGHHARPSAGDRRTSGYSKLSVLAVPKLNRRNLTTVGIDSLSTSSSYGPAGLRSEATRTTCTSFARTQPVSCRTVSERAGIQYAPLLQTQRRLRPSPSTLRGSAGRI